MNSKLENSSPFNFDYDLLMNAGAKQILKEPPPQQEEINTLRNLFHNHLISLNRFEKKKISKPHY